MGSWGDEVMGYRVIIAGEEASLRKELRETMDAAGHSVAAESEISEKLLELVRTHRPDVLLLDIDSVTLDALAVAAAIAGEAITAVALLSDLKDTTPEIAARSGAFGCVVKPFHERQLMAAIEMAVARLKDLWRLRDEAAAAE